MSTIRKGVEQFLRNREAHSPYLIPHWIVDLESQFLVHAGNVKVEEGVNCWTDGQEEWAHHRWPYKAGSDPYYRDKDLKFDPAVHISRVGSTWWNWKTRRSVAVAFDIDTESGHAASTTTVTKTQLESIVSRLKTLPYVTLLRSTGGFGVHVYVFFDKENQPEAANHNEHTQVALAVLEKMKDDLNYDLGQHMDAKGLVFWFWADTSDGDHPGFTLIQEATSPIGEPDIKDYLNKNLQNPNRKVKVHGFTDDGRLAESEVSRGGYKIYPLEEEHKQILKDLELLNYDFIWNAEFNMVHTNTRALRELFQNYRTAGRPLKGVFETTSEGHVAKPNCYITPRPGGVFQIKRFGNGIGEHPLWNSKDQDTWCFYNQEAPVSDVLAKFCSKISSPNQFVFEPKDLESALSALGHTMGESAQHIQSSITVTRKKDGTFFASMEDKGNFPGWRDTKKGMSMELPIVEKDQQRQTTVLEEIDKVARFLVTPEKDPYGWALCTGIGWVMHGGYDNIAPQIKQNFGKEANYVKSLMLANPWTMTHIPFGLEYPDNRKWNLFAPQLAIEPAEKPGPHPHWDMVYDHLGSSLDTAVQSTAWCQQWGITTGADYLRFWLASSIQYPFEPLPYLFFYGDQNTGKSIFRESAAMLFTEGSVRSASGPLTNQQGFNFEIANAVIGYVEEKDLSVVKEGAYARMKEWVTDRTLTVTKKGETPYTQPNTLKLVQMANRPTSCPMEDGDTRITAIAVSSISEKDMIPRGAMGRLLMDEAQYFLRTLLTIHLPESPDRLRVPMLANEDKADLEAMNQEPWEAYAADHLFPCAGSQVKFSEFFESYIGHCTINNIDVPKSKALLQMVRNRSNKYTVGIGRGKQTYIANVSMDPKIPALGTPYILNKNGRLVKCTA